MKKATLTCGFTIASSTNPGALTRVLVYPKHNSFEVDASNFGGTVDLNNLTANAWESALAPILEANITGVTSGPPAAGEAFTLDGKTFRVVSYKGSATAGRIRFTPEAAADYAAISLFAVTGGNFAGTLNGIRDLGYPEAELLWASSLGSQNDAEAMQFKPHFGDQSTTAGLVLPLENGDARQYLVESRLPGGLLFAAESANNYSNGEGASFGLWIGGYREKR